MDFKLNAELTQEMLPAGRTGCKDEFLSNVKQPAGKLSEHCFDASPRSANAGDGVDNTQGLRVGGRRTVAEDNLDSEVVNARAFLEGGIIDELIRRDSLDHHDADDGKVSFRCCAPFDFEARDGGFVLAHPFERNIDAVARRGERSGLDDFCLKKRSTKKEERKKCFHSIRCEQ